MTPDAAGSAGPRSGNRGHGAVVLGVALLALAHGHAPARGDVILIVDTAADVIANDGWCSLREAITAANNNGNYFNCLGSGGGFDLIEFGLGAGTPVINVASNLPVITGPVEINGGPSRVELRGPADGTGIGLSISGSGTGGTSIRNLVVNGFDTGLSVGSTNNIAITGNRIGTNAAGTAAAPNRIGIRLSAVLNATVGGTSGLTPGGACTGACNLVSGNTLHGILAQAASTVTVLGNHLGTSAAGTAAIGNGTGMRSENGSSATIGPANLVSGNGDGIRIQNGAATITGNRIGTNAAGTAAVPNANGIFVLLGNDPWAVGIGGTAPGAGNLVSGNSLAGVVLTTADDVTIEGNRIGTNAAGTAALPNGGAGIELSSSTHGNIIGGTAAGQANLIAYNASGVRVGINNYDNAIRGNSIRDNTGGGIELADFQSSTAFAPLVDGVGPVTGTACPGCIVDVYSDAGGEGATWHGSVAANGAGSWSFGGAVTGPFVTATATNANGGTSEFSAPFPAALPDADGDGVADPADNCTLRANPTQCDSDGDGFGNRCDGDLNGNNFTNSQDTTLFRGQLGKASSPPVFNAADLNCNGFVNSQDTTLFRGLLGSPPGPAGSLP